MTIHSPDLITLYMLGRWAHIASWPQFKQANLSNSVPHPKVEYNAKTHWRMDLELTSNMIGVIIVASKIYGKRPILIGDIDSPEQRVGSDAHDIQARLNSRCLYI